MHNLLIVTLLLPALCLAQSQNPNFAEWKKSVGKKYRSNSEESYRAAIFNKNVQKIKSHNSNPFRSYQQGINDFTDLTTQEFTMTYLTLKAPPAVKSTVLVQDSPNIVGKTKSNVSAYKITAIDWRFKLNSTNANLVPKVRSQGSCGSCWAFAATTSMEFSVSIQFKIYGNFSNAQIVCCANSSAGYGNYGCNGGWMTQAYRYGKTSNISSKTQYPYYSFNGSVFPCDGARRGKGNYTVDTYPTVNSNYKTDALCSPMLERLKVGPYAVALNASLIMNYRGGIFRNNACGSNDVNHGVTLIGNDKNGNWILQNSWGQTWGERGYFRMANGNTCGICKYGGMAVIMKKFA